jgi:hypothetical protein
VFCTAAHDAALDQLGDELLAERFVAWLRTTPDPDLPTTKDDP